MHGKSRKKWKLELFYRRQKPLDFICANLAVVLLLLFVMVHVQILWEWLFCFFFRPAVKVNILTRINGVGWYMRLGDHRCVCVCGCSFVHIEQYQYTNISMCCKEFDHNASKSKYWIIYNIDIKFYFVCPMLICDLCLSFVFSLVPFHFEYVLRLILLYWNRCEQGLNRLECHWRMHVQCACQAGKR